MKVVFWLYLLCFLAIAVSAQAPQNGSQVTFQELLKKHISAAETYQISGDLPNAEIENNRVVGIGLEEVSGLEFRKGDYKKAANFYQKSLKHRESASARMGLALSQLALNDFDGAVKNASLAADASPDSAYYKYILGNTYFRLGRFKEALPHLERSFVLKPDFDTARSLGLTYLHLKELSRAKLLYEELESALGKPSSQLQIVFGQDFETTGYTAEAETAFRRAIQLDAKQQKANFYLGFVILSHGGSERLGEARQAFEKELELTPNDFYSNFFAGVVAVSENELDLSIRYLKKALTLKPNSEEAHLFLGQAYLDGENYPDAETHLKRSIELESKKERKGVQARRTHFMLSRVYLKTNRRELAVEELKKARALQQENLADARDEISRILGQVTSEAGTDLKKDEPNNPAASVELSTAEKERIDNRVTYLSDVLAQSFHNLGVIAIQRNDKALGLRHLNDAYSWKADFPNLRRNIGILSFDLNEFETAIKMFSVHVDQQPGDAKARRMLAVSYYITGDFPNSAKTFEALVPAIYQNAELSYFYGVSLANTKEFNKSREAFNQITERFSSEPPKLFLGAQGFMFLGEFRRAIQYFDAVIKLDPNLSKVNYFKGQSLIRLANHEQAEIAFRNELRLNPLDELSKYHLALTLIERQIKTEEAIRLLNDAIRYKSDYVDARYQLGKLFLGMNRVDDAISQLETAARLDASKDYVHYQLSRAYRKASRKEDAAKHLNLYRKIKAENRKKSAPQPMGNQ